jgi:O-antigen ligase
LGFLAIALFEVFFGLGNWLADRGTIWGIDVPGGGNRLRGTYINSDHMAFYLAMAVCSAYAWLWWAIRRIRRWVSRESWIYLVSSLLVFLLFFVSLAFTGSRAAMVAVGTALLFQTAILTAHYRNWRVGASGLGILVLGFVAVAFLNLQQGLGRWMNTSAYEVTLNSRLETYGATFEIFRLFPYTGSGLGTFRQAFPWVQPADLKGSWVHAHNDILEILVTTGAVGFLILVFGLIALLRRLARVWHAGRRSEDRAVVLAALGSLWAVLAHSLLDFGLSLPSNACTLAILLGAACGVPIHRRRQGRRTPGEASGRGDVDEADLSWISLSTRDYP